MEPEVVATGMGAVVEALKTGLSAEVIMGTFAELVPYLVIIVPVALGVYELRKLVKGAAKAKVRF